MNQRSEDGAVVRIDRTIPLWGIILVAIGLFGNGILMWQGQREAAIAQRNSDIKVDKLVATVESMDAQGRARESKDVARDALLADHERRLTRVETKLEAAR